MVQVESRRLVQQLAARQAGRLQGKAEQRGLNGRGGFQQRIGGLREGGPSIHDK